MERDTSGGRVQWKGGPVEMGCEYDWLYSTGRGRPSGGPVVVRGTPRDRGLDLSDPGWGSLYDLLKYTQ